MLLNLIFAILTFLSPLSIKVTPHFGTPPQDVRIEIITPANPLNTYTCVNYTSDIGEEGSSCWEMLGEREPVIRQYWLKGLPKGRYEVEVVLVQTLNKQYKVRDTFQIGASDE